MPSSDQSAPPVLPKVNIKSTRSAASTPLPLPSNNFTSLGYTFVLLNELSFPVQEITLAVAPEEIQQSEMSTSNVVMTAGDAFTDSFGPGLTQMVISGTFGQRPTGNSIFGDVKGTPTSSGQYLVLQLRDLFRKYLDKLNPIITQDPTKNAGYKLQFYNPKDNEFWNIEPIGNWFTLIRTKRSPFLYRYRLSFVCTGRATSGFSSIVDFQSFRANITNAVGFAYDTVANTLTSISSFGAGVTSLMSQIGSTASDFNSNIFTPFSSLQSAANKYLSKSSVIINYPVSGITSVRENIRQVYEDYSTAYPLNIETENQVYTYTGPYSIPVVDPYMDYQLVKLIEGLDAYALNSNVFSKTFIKSDFINQSVNSNSSVNYIDLSSVKSVTYYTVRGGDTIESIAQLTMGDIKYWKDLAEFNGLAYPYITTITPKPDRTLGPGDSIAVPSINNTDVLNNIILGASTPSSKNSEYALGVDFYLNSSQDIVMEDGDIKTVTGIKNVTQAVFIKLNVHRGELYLHPYFGMADLRGYRAVALLAAKASSEFNDTIKSDSRVGEVSSSSVDIQGDVLNYKAEIGILLNKQPIILEGTLSLSA